MGEKARIAHRESRDALRYWLDQEGRPLPPYLPYSGDERAESLGPAGDEAWPSGWWILPMLAVAAPVWAVLGWWILG